MIEVRGRLFVEAPKNRKRRQTVYPCLTPQGWPLVERVAARIAAVSAEQDAGANPLGLMFPARPGVLAVAELPPPVLEATWLPGGAPPKASAEQWEMP